MTAGVSNPATTGLSPSWQMRLLLFWPVKMIGLTLGMTAFFLAYFWVLQHPHSAPTIMRFTSVDRWIGFEPWSLPLYFSLWLYVALAPSLLATPRELVTYGAGAGVVAAIGLAVFFLWPTAVPRLNLDWSSHPGFAFLKSVDASGNACPSLHVAFAVFTAIWMEKLLREMKGGPLVRVLNWLWCLGILYSTIATRQHVFLDVIAGSVLGSVLALLSAGKAGQIKIDL